MNIPAFTLIKTILIGLGATFTFDLWAAFLKHAFKIAPSNICLVGRWLLYMPEGTLLDSSGDESNQFISAGVSSFPEACAHDCRFSGVRQSNLAEALQ